MNKKLKTSKTEEYVVPGSMKAWVLAARPKTLSAAAVPVAIAAVMALIDMGAEWQRGVIPALLCLVFAFVMQIDANLVNDLFDYRRGTDGGERLGPLRACAQGWISDRSMVRGIMVTTAIACLVGLPLVLYGGWMMLAVGAACVVFCFLYTTFFSYKALGDVLVLLFFGIVPVCTTYYLVLSDATMETNESFPFLNIKMMSEAATAGQSLLPMKVFVMSLACGLVIDTLLAINNYRDIDNDAHADKKTLAVILGRETAGRFYKWVSLAGMYCALLSAIPDGNVGIFVPIILYRLLHLSTYKRMIEIGHGRRLNTILGQTARNIALFGLAVVVEIIAWACLDAAKSPIYTAVLVAGGVLMLCLDMFRRERTLKT